MHKNKKRNKKNINGQVIGFRIYPEVSFENISNAWSRRDRCVNVHRHAFWQADDDASFITLTDTWLQFFWYSLPNSSFLFLLLLPLLLLLSNSLSLTHTHPSLSPPLFLKWYEEETRKKIRAGIRRKRLLSGEIINVDPETRCHLYSCRAPLYSWPLRSIRFSKESREIIYAQATVSPYECFASVSFLLSSSSLLSSPHHSSSPFFPPSLIPLLSI